MSKETPDLQMMTNQEEYDITNRIVTRIERNLLSRLPKPRVASKVASKVVSEEEFSQALQEYLDLSDA